MIKTYILDTNILLKSPQSIFGFDDNNVCITAVTVEELDRKKNDVDREVEYNARQVINIIKKLRKQGNLLEGVKLPNGGIFKVITLEDKKTLDLPAGWKKDKPDNLIIQTIESYMMEHFQDEEIILITNDGNLQIKADCRNIPVQDYNNERIPDKVDLYTGRSEYFVPEKIIDELYSSENGINVHNINFYSKDNYKLISIPNFFPNEFITLYALENEKKSILAKYKNSFIKKLEYVPDDINGITPLNSGQKFALEALLAPVDEIPLVFLSGIAGCVDCDTEYFNGKQWKRISEYSKGEKVLQYDTKTGMSELVYPLYYIKKKCDKFYEIKTDNNLKQVLSPEHRIIYYENDNIHNKITGPYEITAKNLVDKQDFKGTFKTTFNFNGKGINFSDDEIKLMCLTIINGTFNKDNAKSKNCFINIKDNDNKKYLVSLLENLNIKYKISHTRNNIFRICFEAPTKELTFSEDWYNCTKHQMETVYNTIINWCKRDNYDYVIETENKNIIDFIQFVFACCDKRLEIIEYHRKASMQGLSGKIYTHRCTTYCGFLSNNNMGSFKKRNKQYISKDGYKYCFTVPSGALVLRRNNNIFITGNCSKTFLSLLAGLYQTIDKDIYKRILICRPNTKFDDDIGYLKGTELEKITPLIRPFYDNLETILELEGYTFEEIPEIMESYFDSGIIKAEAMAYMRGRSITNTYIVVDEAQNSTVTQILGMITRAGKGSKIVICGDPDQIDNIKLDKRNNGLVFGAEKMKISNLSAIVAFNEENEVKRSDLSREAAKLLTVSK